MQNPQNCQTHSNNSSATADNCLSVFDHFVRLALKGLSHRKAVSENIGLGVILYTVVKSAVKIYSLRYPIGLQHRG